MYLDATLTLPFVDADRKGGNQDGGGGLSYRARFAAVLLAMFVVWLFLRINDYFR